jgi:NTP pyrophosphatase (non-canonical NTP hydrolase)
MNIQEYQDRANALNIASARLEEIAFSRNLDNIHLLLDLNYTVQGINGEAGEIADIVKKVMRDDRGMFSPQARDSLEKEVGDTLWYISQLCTLMGWKMEDVMETNINKLEERAARGTLTGSGDDR